MLPTKWGTYMKLVTKYQISAINICWEKCDEKWTYMFNVYKNQLSRQTGSRNLTGPKTLPTIWHTYMKLVTKYQISAIHNCWEKCDEKYLGTDRQTDRGKTVYHPPTPGSGGIITSVLNVLTNIITSITAHTIGLTVILVIMSVLTFITTFILYIYHMRIIKNQCTLSLM
jgi:hypothetical protein